MTLLWLCWGCKPPHSAVHIHNTCIWSVWAPVYAVERHLGAPIHSYNGAEGRLNFGELGSGRAKMTLWNRWGSKPPHSASHIYNTCIWSVWAPSYAVERHLGAALHSYNDAEGGPNFGKLGSGGAKMTLWCHCWGCKPPHSASHIHSTCKWWKIGVRRS